MKRTNEPAPKPLRWLQTARQQSHSLAELRAAHAPPFDWDCRRPRRVWAGRTAWLTAGLAVGVLGLATVTMATIRGRRAASSRPEAPRVAAPQRVAAPRSPAVPRPAARGELEPAAAAPAPRPRMTGRALPGKPAPATQPARAPAGQVIFDGEEPGTTIVVKPPSRLGPLWTPDEYKKKRAGQLKY